MNLWNVVAGAALVTTVVLLTFDYAWRITSFSIRRAVLPVLLIWVAGLWWVYWVLA
ncbi:hypothetical protein [Acidihalobacter yilgarnensis]|uniref:hypothetical protein n=1 Tax=Acidihalobacter yilgarnensis TaxID=2819280 RepID=UPI0012EA6319|nr:hypothetical protein [Acidihalobacter yilgarnensis]